MKMLLQKRKKRYKIGFHFFASYIFEISMTLPMMNFFYFQIFLLHIFQRNKIIEPVNECTTNLLLTYVLDVKLKPRS